MAAQTFLRDHPDLLPFLLSSATPTGRTIGTGSYGSVEEVAIPGAVCAAKKIHDFFQDPRQMPRHGIEKAASEFVRECQLMSTLRHPHIVQFLGVCFLPGSRMPALVMEKLVTSLHDVLDPEPPPTTKPFIPVSLKRSILHDVARGLSFLHSITPEPIIHRDLSARNVLLNEGMVAKIADLGMARIVPNTLRQSTMTKAPGASIYMPPEALEDKSRYDTTIDIFSFGVVAIFTFSQMFPDPVAMAYEDDNGRMVGRTELQRRGNYMSEVTKQFREGHPLVIMIQQCLKNKARQRPNIDRVCGWLEEARGKVGDGEFDVNKLLLTQLLHSRDTQQRQKIRQTQQENSILKQQITSLEEQMQSLTSENTASPKVQWPLSLDWKQGKDIPTAGLTCASSTVINGKVYCGGDPTSNAIFEYSPDSGDWSELPRPPVGRGFAVTSFNSQLVLVGDLSSDKIVVWDSGSREWDRPYPTLPTGRPSSAAVSHQKYLIVACGFERMNEVDVLDSSSGRWYSAQPVPMGGHLMSSAVVDNCWYLSAFGGWKDRKEHIFWTHLPTLISTATSLSSASGKQVWHELPTPPDTQPALLALQGHLLLVGGWGYVQEFHRYDRETKQWMVCGQLPLGMRAPCCAVLPSGDLMVAGGWTKGSSNRMWTSKISNKL